MSGIVLSKKGPIKMREPNPEFSPQQSVLTDREPERLEFGVTRFFGSIDVGRSGLWLGWAEPEDAHNWSEGCQSVLAVAISDPGEGCTIEFAGEPYFNERCQRQDVILHVNGFHVGHWRLSDPASVVLSARIEKEQMFLRNGLMMLRCAWSFPDSISPAALGLSADSRELAFCFRSITFEKIAPSSSGKLLRNSGQRGVG